MPDLQFYLDREISEDKRHRLLHQYREAVESQTITCICGLKRALHLAYKCLYCGEWFCFGCGQTHFGKTYKQYQKEKNQGDNKL